MSNFIIKVFLFCLLCQFINCKNCMKIGCTLTQNIGNEGFHRTMHWLVEVETTEIPLEYCFLLLHQEIPSGAFINPDQISDLNRIGKTSARIEGNVDVEKPMHYSEPHFLYLYTHMNDSRINFEIPIHLRYQRPQISGDYGKVEFSYPSLLFRCKNKLNICGKKIPAPVAFTKSSSAVWTNVTYDPISEKLEVVVPLGDLDHYPLVSVVTFFVTCCGCIYLLSVILSKPLPTKKVF